MEPPAARTLVPNAATVRHAPFKWIEQNVSSLRCLRAAAGKPVGVLLEEYADSSAAGEGASHPALTHDGQAREIRTCAHAGSAEQAPQPMNEDNPESVRSTVTMSTPAIPGHGTSITCARLLLRSMGEP